MDALELEFHIAGPDAQRLADELADLMAAELGTRPRRADGGSGPPEPVRMRGVDPLAAAAVVLAILGAVLATQDLARRLELKQKVDRVLDWARRKRGQDAQNRIEIVAPDGKTVRLDLADSAGLIEIAMEQVTVRVTPGREGPAGGQ